MNAKMQSSGVDRAREMSVFAAVAAGGSFSAAGRTLGLTPSAISRTLDRIEARLGVRLMLRTTRALTLTPEGQAYLQNAVAGKVRAAFQREMAGSLTGTRPVKVQVTMRGVTMIPALQRALVGGGSRASLTGRGSRATLAGMSGP